MSIYRRKLMISNALDDGDDNINYLGLIAAWSVEGKKNNDFDRDVLKDLTGNGHDITLHGFAFNTEGSGYENPEYPGALVFDGIDDYGVNNDMPILTDYTIIVKRKHINAQLYAPTISKFSTNDSDGNGAFLFELPNYNGRFTTFSFGVNNQHIKIIPTISWQTKNYHNQTKIFSGTHQDGKNITFGKLKNGENFLSFAFYSAYLFDRSLGEQEIKAFIRKYIDPEYVLPNEQSI